MEIAFDVDNVLADSMSLFCKKASKKLGTKVTKDIIRTHTIVGSIRLAPKEIFRLQDDVWRNWIEIPPTENSISEKLEALREKGFGVCVATSRPKRSIELVKLWLSQNRIAYDNFYSVGGNVSKSNIPSDVLVDDAPEQVKAFVREGKIAFLYDQPWNQGKTVAGVNRIKSVDEILGYYKISL